MVTNKLRSQCPALLNKTYFNYGGQGPLPTPSLEAIQASWRRIQELGPFTTDVWPFIGAEVSSTRRRLAQLCGVAPHRLALSENVTSGCVLPLPVKQLRGDQPSTDAGVMDALEQSLTPRSRLVVLSHLLWNTGQIMPIPAVAERLAQHPQAPYLLVDAAQSFGQIPVQDAAAAADIYAFTGHKWACGPEGLGGVALSERVLNEGQPTVIGWRSLQDESKADLSSSDPFHHDSRRFEVATSCVPLMAGLRSSLELLDQEGSAETRLARIRQLSGDIWSGLRELPGVKPLMEVPPASGLVSFQLSCDAAPAEVVQQLGQQGLWIRDLADPSCLRACTHVTTTEAETEALTTAIARY